MEQKVQKIQSINYDVSYIDWDIAFKNILIVMIIVLTLALFSCFTLPDKGPIHPSVLSKVNIVLRICSFLILFSVVQLLVRHPKSNEIFFTMLPMLLYVILGVISTLWSPMKVLTFGHALEFLLVVLFGYCVAMISNKGQNISILLCSLVVLLNFQSCMVLFAHYFVPSLVNLADGGARGLVHPGQGGRMAIYCMTTILLSLYLWRWTWTKILLVPTIFIQLTLLIICQRRTPIFIFMVFTIMFFALKGNKKNVILIVLGLCFGCFLYLCVDPHLEIFGKVQTKFENYMLRGQTTEQMISMSGRENLWPIFWAEFLKSPLIGHGYSMAASTGVIYYHGLPIVGDAHNAFLQVLASNGVIGFALFLWAFFGPCFISIKQLKFPYDDERFKIGVMFLFFTFITTAFGMTSSFFTVKINQAIFAFIIVYGITIRNLTRGST